MNDTIISMKNIQVNKKIRKEYNLWLVYSFSWPNIMQLYTYARIYIKKLISLFRKQFVYSVFHQFF